MVWHDEQRGGIDSTLNIGRDDFDNKRQNGVCERDVVRVCVCALLKL